MNNIEYINREADHCVKCGLCLPHCPTYAKTRDEGDSPRGRISLMQGLAQNQLAISTRLEFHLDRCLTCRACENVCPSNVRYGQLIDAARTLIRERHAPSARQRTVQSWLIDPLIFKSPLAATGIRMLRIYQQSGLRWLTRKSGLLKLFKSLRRMENILPDIPPHSTWQEFYSAYNEQKGQVALFTGCISSLLDRETITSTIELLRHCGFGVHVPSAQTCCGALHQHSGMTAQARRLANDNLAVFNNLNVAAVLFTSSGCGVTLDEYPLMDTRTGFKVPVLDISQFLNTIEWPADLNFQQNNLHVMIHDPCSLRHVMHQEKEPYKLLHKIPGLNLTPLPGNDRCCGAAGSYMLSQPDMADSLRDDKIAHLAQSNADYLVTSNIGCALHLMSAIRAKNLNIEVIHPATLLVRQLITQKDAQAHV